MRFWHVFIISFLITNLYSQSISQHRNNLSILSGMDMFYTKDESLSPLIYKGACMPISLNYKRVGDNSFHNLNIHFSKTELTSNTTINNTDRNIGNYEDIIFAMLEYSYYHKFLNKFNVKDLYLGARLKNNIFYKQHYFNPSITSWPAGDVFSGFNISLYFQRQISEKLIIQGSTDYSVFSYVIGRIYASNHTPEKARKEIEISYSKILLSGDFLTVNSFFDFTFNLQAKYNLSNSITVIGNYNFNYYRYHKLSMMQFGKNTFLIGIGYEF